MRQFAAAPHLTLPSGFAPGPLPLPPKGGEGLFQERVQGPDLRYWITSLRENKPQDFRI